MRRCERASTLLTSNQLVMGIWVKLRGDTDAVTTLLDQLLPYDHDLFCGPKSYRTQLQSGLFKKEATR